MEDISLVLLPLEFFVCLKNILFDLHQEKVLCYTQFQMYSTLKTRILTKSTFFFVKLTKNYFHEHEKNNQTFGQKKVLVCLEGPMGDL